MRKAHLLVVLVVSLALCACAPMLRQSTTVPLLGGWYTSVTYPHASPLGEGVGMGKVGKSCATGILGVIATGDASIATAMHNGGITKVAIIDHKTLDILGFYAKYCTIVRGE